MKRIHLLFAIIGLLCLKYSFTAHASSRPADSVLHQKAPAFTIKDLNGKAVKLSDYEGKIIVIDFWASWCIPCHESFPTMQKAVSRYAGHPDVAFLFISTREKSANPQKSAMKDMQKNHYNFHVALDERDVDGVQDKYYKRFGMLGIPTQFIIDKEGFIRYKIEGYDPRKTDKQAAEDLVKLIEKTKKPAH
ncbi:MAG: alkyl hydroperoxide reductase/Thiol specific antioxidant/Mal allergen [Mucilaginibacter sp.]|nr:alkyl hydroperoxide reductase/Thiol specific antioxidant/Mal allergen [Mucilaginibacter sp.]